MVIKARKIAAREGRDWIGELDAANALRALRPATPAKADYFTMLAVQACNDTELLRPGTPPCWMTAGSSKRRSKIGPTTRAGPQS